MTEHEFIINEITAICNNLGKIDENDGRYMRSPDCKPCLREIQRYLINDSKHHTTRCLLGSFNIIKSDLIPLLVQYCDYNEGDPELFNTVIRICTNITSSILLLFGENQEVENKEEQAKLENKLQSGLYSYKEAFAENDQIWSTLNTHLRHNRDDELIFERIIILIRNILHIPVDSTADMGVHSEFDTHDMCIYRMQRSGMLDTIIELTSDTNKGAEFCFHLTEIIYLILRDQNPETLAKAKASLYKRKLDESDVDKKRLAELSARNRREREERSKFTNQLRFKGSSFVVQNRRSISENHLVVTNKPLLVTNDIKFDKGKTDLRKAKNRLPPSSETSMNISDRNIKITKISYCLKCFTEKFVKDVYNDYMQRIKHNLIQKRAQENDESYYLWAIQFFSAFCRHLYLNLDFISETLSISTLHFIQISIISYQEKIMIEKKIFHNISKRLHLALRAYKEVLILLKSNRVKEIENNIFGQVEYKSILLNLLQHYDDRKHSDHYLHDLILTNHAFMELLDRYYESQDKMSQEYMYCCPNVIKAYLKVLKNFKNNDDTTNLALLKFFERIAYDCSNDVILCQASIFRCLIGIVDYHPSMPGYDGFKNLLIHLIKKFGSMANKQRWMYQELLFWKASTDVVEIENAIDPPPAPPVEPLITEDDFVVNDNVVDENEVSNVNDDNFDVDANNEFPTTSLDALRAELWDSDDSSSSIAIPGDDNPLQAAENSDDELIHDNDNVSDNNNDSINNNINNNSNDDNGKDNESESNNEDPLKLHSDDDDDSNFNSQIKRFKSNKCISDDDEEEES